MRALYFNKFGSADVLRYGELADPTITASDVLVQTTYIGLNYADIYRRRGTYHIESHDPYIDGYEGVGTVVAVGADVTHVGLGERVLFVDVPLANAELVRVPADHIIQVPDSLSDQDVASIGLQGLTADFLVHDLAQNVAGKRVLVHGISGGVGQLLAQILVAQGAEVTGIVSTPAKQRLVQSLGVQQVFLRNTDWATACVATFDLVFDGAGVTLPTSLRVLKHRGSVIFYGMAGGNPPAIDPVALLAESKSILTGDLWDYFDSFAARQTRSQRLFQYVARQQIKLNPPTIMPLTAGKAAHQFLESGKSTGKILLQPESK